MNNVEREAASFIAAQPGGPQRLLGIHQPDEQYRCRGCSTPGTGTPHDAWPCPSFRFAALAARLVADQAAAQLAAKPAAPVRAVKAG